MTGTPPTAPTGQPTLEGVADFFETLIADIEAVAPEVAKLVEAGVEQLQTIVTVLDPAAGREVEREAEIAALFAAKDVAGLIAYDADQPPHPTKSREIARNDLKMLGYDIAQLPPLP